MFHTIVEDRDNELVEQLGDKLNNALAKQIKQFAEEEGIPEANFRVDYMSFDELTYDAESFDIVFSNEAILHSQDKEKLMFEIAKIVKKDGCCIISDILESPTVDKA